jgi:hypothetical protein
MIGRKPQLADATISRNPDRLKDQIGQKRTRYGPPAHFRPISSIFAVFCIEDSKA